MEKEHLPRIINIRDKEFRMIQKIVYDRLGIHLTEQKRSLVTGRLQKTLKALDFSSFQDYCEYLLADKTGRAMTELANRITTGHTFFYREKGHFDFFIQSVLPEIEAFHNINKDRDLRIWCAGCSTGEEAYTIAMILLEYFGDEYSFWEAGLLATDISTRALETARAGCYIQERLHYLPPMFKHKYFKKTREGLYQVNETLKKEITFRRFNLINTRFPFRKRFDAIFCRNVMIYFNAQTRLSLVKRFYEFTKPGGYLFIGHSESLARETCPYHYIMPSVYRKEMKKIEI